MSDRSRSAMYDAVIQFFEEDPRRWITGCPARDDTGAPCDSLDEHAKRFCFLGAWMHLGFPPELCPQPIACPSTRAGETVARSHRAPHCSADPTFRVQRTGFRQSGRDRSTIVASAPLPTVRTVTQTPPRQLQAKTTHPSLSAC